MAIENKQLSDNFSTAVHIGDPLPDGWVVGPVGDNGIVMSIEPVKSALDGYQTWYRGEGHARELRGKGHANARQPSDRELNAIYNDIVKAGRNGNAQFNTNDSEPSGACWSGTCFATWRNAWRQFFGSGLRFPGNKDLAIAYVRCVRDEPGLKLVK